MNTQGRKAYSDEARTEVLAVLLAERAKTYRGAIARTVEITGINRQTLHRWMRAENLEIQKWHTREEKARILAIYHRTPKQFGSATTATVAKRAGIVESTISRWLQEERDA